MENKTADIIQETKKLHIRRKGSGSGSSDAQNQVSPAAAYGPWQQQQMQTNQETQLKASRDVRWPMCNCLIAREPKLNSDV